MNKKLVDLQSEINKLTKEDTCIAFSGGVDSSILLKLASIEAQKNNTRVYAVTFQTKLHPQADMEIAKKVAEECNAHHIILEVDELANKDMLNNPIDRCYICKRYLFKTLRLWAEKRNVKVILDGTNADDLMEYRPGLRALRKLEIISPLAMAGVTKKEVRAFAKELSLSVSNRPSAPCMATRLPYNSPIDFEILKKLEKGEEYLKSLGFKTVRLRLHRDIIRIEIPKEDFISFLMLKERVSEKLKDLGFVYITLDIEGFRSGSMDVNILSNQTS